MYAGIEPYVTLYHWDLPQALEDKYNGWLDRQIIKDFAAYAEICFQKFGDRVKNWITINEPHTVTIQGYDAGNSATEPYIVAHNLLLSHATAVDIYKRKYQPKQRGRIAITIDSFWYEPMSKSRADIDAKQRALDFYLGWFLEPVITGDYPRSMRSRVGDRLPKFSAAESALVKGSYDFVGINHYTTWYVTDNKTNIIGIFLNDTTADSGAVTLRMYFLKTIQLAR
nr:beta-glucosidase 40-like [Ipomoea batatas]